MYCSGCGQLLDVGQTVCAKCGRPVTAQPAAAAPYDRFRSFRVQRNLQALGTLWLVYAAWNVVQVLIAATLLTGMTGIFGDRLGMNPGIFWERFPFYNAPWLVTLITTLTVGRALLSAATGLAPLSRAPWGRMLALVAAFLTVFKPLLGTALAIYTLWVLIPGASAREYEEISVPTR